LIKALCRALLFICGIRLRVSGRENALPGRQYVVMMNHVSLFDPFVFYAAFPGIARGAEEESHFRWPVYGGTIRRIGMFPIDRKNTERAVESLRRAAVWIRERPIFSFGILPEGTRTLDGRLGLFKRGGFLLALETGLDVLPLVQSGGFKISRKGSLLIRPGRIDIAIEPAVPVAGYTRETAEALIERVRAVFLARLGE
jgi:1-acyl-sn-glycerol-3-phosphate acyltransferase